MPLLPKESSLRLAVRPFIRALRERQGDPGVRQVGTGTAQGAWHRLWHCEDWGRVAVPLANLVETVVPGVRTEETRCVCVCMCARVLFGRTDFFSARTSFPFPLRHGNWSNRQREA